MVGRRTESSGSWSFMNVDKEGCMAAALSVEGVLRHDGLFKEVEWPYAPFGCSIGNDNLIYYNNETGVNNGNYASICHELPVSFFSFLWLYFLCTFFSFSHHHKLCNHINFVIFSLPNTMNYPNVHLILQLQKKNVL